MLQLELDCPLSADGRSLGANWLLAFNKMPLICYDVDFQGFVPCGLGGFPGWDQIAPMLSSQFSQSFPAWGQETRDLCRQQLPPALWASSRGRRSESGGGAGAGRAPQTRQGGAKGTVGPPWVAGGQGGPPWRQAGGVLSVGGPS